MTGQPVTEADLRGAHAEYERPRVAELEATLDMIARQSRAVDIEVPTDSNSLRFGLIGDTHFGSLYEATDQLRAFYRTCADAGIRIILHAGDVLDGHRIYKGQEYELHKIGWEAQSDWFAEVAPGKDEGITTYFIAGNHDASFKKAAGMNVGRELQARRPDWIHVGADYGRVELRTADGRPWRVLLVHPDGGTPYAISYRAQNIIRDLEGGSKPHMVAIGHLHKSMLIPSIRNLATYQVGCFQRQTPYMVRKPTAAHVGGWIITVTPGTSESLCNQIESRFIAFYSEAVGCEEVIATC